MKHANNYRKLYYLVEMKSHLSGSVDKVQALYYITWLNILNNLHATRSMSWAATNCHITHSTHGFAKKQITPSENFINIQQTIIFSIDLYKQKNNYKFLKNEKDMSM